MMYGKKISGIILAGGEGKRFASSTPKQFKELDNKPIIQYTIDTMNEIGVDHIILVAGEEHGKYVGEYLLGVDQILISHKIGRQVHTYAGLKACPSDTDIVVVHDAVRPLASRKSYEDCIQAVAEYEYDGAEPFIYSPDTISRVIGNTVFEVPKRKQLRIAHTPQVFDYQKILKAFRDRQAFLNDYTDEVGIAVDAGLKVACLEGDIFGHKITYPYDFDFLERLMWQEDYKLLPIEVAGKRVLVLGGSGGIGKEVVHLMKHRGADVHAPTSDEVNIRIPGWTLELDPPYDIIINAAGIMLKDDWKSNIDFSHIIHTNFYPNVVLTWFASDLMPNGGNIVWIGSSAANTPRTDIAIYSAMKAALANWTRSASDILKEHNINVNCVSPARVKTRMMKVIGLYETECLDPKNVAKIICGYACATFTGRIVNIRKGATV